VFKKNENWRNVAILKLSSTGRERGWNRLPPTELKMPQSTSRFRRLRQLETIFLFLSIRYDTPEMSGHFGTITVVPKLS